VFVKVRHEFHAGDRLAIREEQDLAYRGRPGADADTPAVRMAPGDAEWTRRVDTDPVLLFRYSALTFNGFRPHYDREYAVEVENYPGLVIHAPLIATMLLDLLRNNIAGAHVATFSFRAVAPLFDTAPFVLCGRRPGNNTVELWAATLDGVLAMEARATLNDNGCQS
jgi:3-methylfumaryl-CoA hydratase